MTVIFDVGSTALQTTIFECLKTVSFLSFADEELIYRVTTWFQQDSATADTARASMTAVPAAFLDHVISRFGDVPRSLRSPHLSISDFYLWGFLKSCVNAGKPCTLGELKTAIRENIQEIGEESLVKVETNFRK